MTVVTHVLVVANQTVDAEELLARLRARAARGPIDATLLVPVTWSAREAAQQRAATAVAALAEAGIAATAVLGDADPIVAVQEAWHPGRYDEILVATLAEGSSRWLQVGLPQRVSRLTDCPVDHVVVRTPAPHVTSPAPAPALEHRGVLDSAMSFLQTPRSPRRP